MKEYLPDAARGVKKRRKSLGLLLPGQKKIMRNIWLGTNRILASSPLSVLPLGFDQAALLLVRDVSYSLF